MLPFFENRYMNKQISYTDNVLPYPSHFHADIEILYCTEGKLDIIINGEHIVISKSSFVICDGNDVHAIIGCDRYITVIIPTCYLLDFNVYKGNKTFGTNVVDDNDGKLLGYLEQLNVEKNNLYIQGCVDKLLGAILDITGLKDTEYKNLNAVRDVLEYIDKHYKEDVNLTILSKKFGYNKSYLSAMFNKVVGQNLNAYLNGVKISRFMFALKRNPNADVQTLAFECGFTSIQTFYRVFKNNYFVTPQEYIKNLKI